MPDVIDRIVKEARHGYGDIQIEDGDVPKVARWMQFEMEATGTATEADLYLCEKRLRAGLMAVEGMRIRVEPKP